MAQSAVHYRLPDPLRVSGGDTADNWRRFRAQFENYVVAADLADASSEKRAAVFLTCIGADAYDVYRAMHFESDADSKKIEPILTQFETFCVGAVNETYERYRFNKRVQDANERFDVFLGEIRRLAKNCHFEAVEESMLRNRIVVGIRDDATRRKLLQVRDLTLNNAIDICKASEAAGRQLKAMSTPEDVQLLQSSSKLPPPQRRGGRGRGRAADNGQRRRGGQSVTRRDHDRSVERSCRYCGRQHDADKRACPAYGQTCSKCHKRNHFAAVCRASASSASQSRQQTVKEISEAESLLTLDNASSKRIYSNVFVDNRKVRFLLDCGSTVNLLPRSIVSALGQPELRPARATLRMYDATELPTIGMVTATVRHPRTGQQFSLEFYVTEREDPILGIDACRRLDMLRIVEHNICEMHESAHELSPSSSGLTSSDICMKYGDLFDGSLGCMAGEEVHLEVDPNVPPVQMPLRRLPVALRDQVKAELDRLVADEVIAPVTEPTKWVNALLVVQKPDGQGVRICIDPKFLNRALQRSKYYMQTIDDILPKLTNVKVMSSVDIRQAFWMLKLDKESSMLTTFETPFGRYRWRRLAMGLSVSPEIFAARIQAALSGLKGVYCIADDILITGSGDDVSSATCDHDANFIALLDRCRQKGVKLNKEKLKMNRQSVSFMGHVLSPEGLRPDRRKVDAIRNIPQPDNKAALQCLLGMTTYLARYCPGYSEVTSPLRHMLAQQNDFRWDERHTAAMEQLKRLLTTAPVLGYYSPEQEVTMQCDSSSYAISAVLLQNGKVIEYASRAMTDAERNYAQIEKELLSILFGFERYHTYLYARPDRVTVQTDHKPLLAIAKKALGSAPKRLQRMLLRLQRYNFDLQWVPGSQLVLADTLSRSIGADTATIDSSDAADEIAALTCDGDQLSDLQMVASRRTINELRAAAADDDTYQRLKAQIMAG